MPAHTIREMREEVASLARLVSYYQNDLRHRGRPGVSIFDQLRRVVQVPPTTAEMLRDARLQLAAVRRALHDAEAAR